MSQRKVVVLPPSAAIRPVEETAGYLSVGRDQLYYVVHHAVGVEAAPAPRVLLVGPFASDRSHIYVSWVRWARHLASAGFEAVRFDPRGSGESTGQQTDMSFATWVEDVSSCISWLDSNGRAPLALHGFGGGALVANKAFRAGMGDALLLWAPPASGREMLMALLRRRLAADLALGFSPPGGRDHYVARLEGGESIEVDGFEWSPRLWADAADFTLSLPDAAVGSGDRPCKVVQPEEGVNRFFAGDRVAPPQRGRGLGHRIPLNPDMTGLFSTNVAWLRKALIAAGERQQ